MAWFKCVGNDSSLNSEPLQIRSSVYENGYLPIFNNTFIDYTKSFEIAIRFKLSNSISSSSNILILGSEIHEYANPSIAIYENRTRIWYGASTDNNSWDIWDQFDLQTAMSSNVWYTIVYGINANSFTQYCKLLDADGDIIAQKSNTISNLPWSSHSSDADLLKFLSNTSLEWIETKYIDVDINKTYIKNENLVWGVGAGAETYVEPTTKNLLFKNGSFYNQDKIQLTLYNAEVDDKVIKATGECGGFVVSDVTLPTGTTYYLFNFIMTQKANNGEVQIGRNFFTTNLQDIMEHGTSRISFSNITPTVNEECSYGGLIPVSQGVFCGGHSAGTPDVYFEIKEITFSALNTVIP